MIVSTTSLKIDPNKVAAVEEWGPPKTLRDVQSLLGFANFYNIFIKAFSALA
jgi:hypothetical protein